MSQSASPYIQHITLNTGHSSRAPRAAVHDETLAVMVPWLHALLERGRDARSPLPAPGLEHFSASAAVHDGALVLTLLAPLGPHVPGKPGDGKLPLITMGVAQRSRQGAELWQMMIAQPGARPGLTKPQEPWLAALVYPSAVGYRGDLGWMGDFEACVAWAWITRRPDLSAA